MESTFDLLPNTSCSNGSTTALFVSLCLTLCRAWLNLLLITTLLWLPSEASLSLLLGSNSKLYMCGLCSRNIVTTFFG